MRRSAYTLVEVLLALAIAVVLLGALYVAVDVQLRTAQAGRDKVEQSTLVRTIFNRFDSDAACVVGLADTARFRRMQTSAASSASTASAAGGASTASTPSSSSATTTSSATTSTITSLSSTGTVSTYTNANGVQVVILPYGVIGTAQTLNMFVNRVPREMLNAQIQQQEGTIPLAGDVRRISYWLLDGGGLARQEVKVLTSDDSGAIDQNSLPPNVDNPKVFIEEVKSLQFEYFDGTNWNDSWDSTQASTDGLTPIGSPVAIRVTVGVAQAGHPDLQPKSYQHVITFPTANGTTVMQQTTPSTTGGGTTSP